MKNIFKRPPGAKRREIIEALLHGRSNPSHFLGNAVQFLVSWIIGIGVPCITVALTIFVKILLNTKIAPTPYVLLFIPVIVSSFAGGFYSGALATLLGIFATNYALMIAHPGVFSTGTTISTIIYIFEGLIISLIIQQQLFIRNSLFEIEDRFNLLFSNTRDYAIIFLDPYGNITRWNSGAQRLFGYKEQEALGKHLSFLFTPIDRGKKLPEKEYRTALTRNRSMDENLLQKKDGSSFWASGFTTALWDKKNNIRGFVKLVRDITQTKEAEQHMEDFISIASHELKTPIASIGLYTQLLQKFYKTHVIQEREPPGYVQKIQDQLQEIQVLINRLLDVSQIQQKKLSLDKSSIDITHLVDDGIETVDRLHPDFTIMRKGRIAKKLFVDRSRMQEVITNLLTNAIKYSAENKKIIVHLSSTREYASIKVQDFGVGMTEEQRTKIFERFYRASQVRNVAPGIGLGLYIAAQIVKAHQGKIEVESQLGKGSIFSVILPKK